ncbi:MAG: hypothetical protein M0Z94_15970 [Dehalococcoidales bacterium]|nr:hypothetical protein [Dehalococcoidales bacterium]
MSWLPSDAAGDELGWDSGPSPDARPSEETALAADLRRAGLDRERLGDDVGSLVRAWSGRRVGRDSVVPTGGGYRGLEAPPAVQARGLDDEDTLLGWLRDLAAARYGPRAELALAPVGVTQRTPAESAGAPTAAEGTGDREEEPGADEPDLDVLASEVYARLRQRLEVERERLVINV